MSIFSRIFSIGKAAANKVVDKFEKPELMLEQAIREKEKQILEAKKAVQSCIATERQTKALLEKEKEDALIWEQKAEQAILAGQEDLAAKALSRASEHESKARELQPNWESQKTQVDELKRDIQSLDDELLEFKRNKDFVLAQSKAAEVKKKMYEAKARISKNKNPDDLMARMKEKAERNSLEAAAAQELAESFDGKDSLEKEFETLSANTHSLEVQKKLSALKTKLGNRIE